MNTGLLSGIALAGAGPPRAVYRGVCWDMEQKNATPLDWQWLRAGGHRQANRATRDVTLSFVRVPDRSNSRISVEGQSGGAHSNPIGATQKINVIVIYEKKIIYFINKIAKPVHKTSGIFITRGLMKILRLL